MTTTIQPPNPSVLSDESAGPWMRGASPASERPASELPLLLSAQDATRRSRNVVAIVIVLSLGIFLALVPFAKERLPAWPLFVPIYQTVLVVNDLVTAMLLFLQLRVARSVALLVLACGYVYTALMALMHLLTFPGVFGPSGVLGGGAQTTAYMFVFWHAGFLLLAMAYTVLKAREKEDGVLSSRSVATALAATLALVAALTVLATWGNDLFPPILHGNQYSSTFNVARYGQWALAAAAIFMLWRSRSKSLLDTWLLVVLFSWFIEIALVAIFNGGRYDLGFYAGRIYGLLASCFLLVVLLWEQGRMYVALLAAREMQRSEAEARAMADGIPQLAWIARADGWIYWYNRRWYDYTGMTSADMEGWGWKAVHDPGTLPAVMEQWQRSLDSGEPFEMVFPLRGADGVYRSFLTRVVPLKDDQGRVQRWFGTNTDITAQRELELALRSTDRRKDEFIATLGHELRNPLAPIRNSVAMMKLLPNLSPEMVRVRDVVDRQSQHLARLIDDLLDVSRVKEGKIQLQTSRIGILDCLSDALESVRPAIDAKKHQLRLELPDDSLEADADPTRVTQIFANLLVNACRFTPAGGVIHVSAFREDDWAVVRVADNGIGIAPEDQERIFGIFSQLEAAARQPQAGLGIGLALVKGFVELHGGTVAVHSEGRGHGSSFVVRLPLVA